MKEYRVRVQRDGKSEELSCAEGLSLFQVLEGRYRERINTPCGGKQKCGKCKILAPGTGLSPLSPFEKSKLTDKEIKDGVRLACAALVRGDVTVTLGIDEGAVQILESVVDLSGPVDPYVSKTCATLPEPGLEDQRDDLTRLKDGLKLRNLSMRPGELAKLPELLRQNNYRVTAVSDKSEILSVEPGDTTGVHFGIAADIGTTTVVVYLLDLTNGKKIDVASGLNVQRAYGYDVISRINHTMLVPEGLTVLRDAIIGQLNDLIAKVAERNDIDVRNIYVVTIAGNTTMMHLAAGLPPKNIASVPFIPVAKELMVLKAEDFGIRVAPAGKIILLPGISAYVGADIVAAVLASGMAFDKRLSLLIDIGTNGEIVLGNSDSLISCSTAAGPAFEGASIRDGVGGIAGAINTLSVDDTGLYYTTIDHQKPLGVCGSGIVDAISNLLTSGVIEKTGRMLAGPELPGGEGHVLKDHLTNFENQSAFILAYGKNTKNGDNILLTQKDVREIQNAKASIAAGILTLIKKAGKQAEDIEVVYLAGGFGSFMNKYHAVNIGLLPKELESKIEVIGNAAGSGAVMSLLSDKNLRDAAEIATRISYVELSSSPEFMEDYINCMMF